MSPFERIEDVTATAAAVAWDMVTTWQVLAGASFMVCFAGLFVLMCLRAPDEHEVWPDGDPGTRRLASDGSLTGEQR